MAAYQQIRDASPAADHQDFEEHELQINEKDKAPDIDAEDARLLSEDEDGLKPAPKSRQRPPIWLIVLLCVLAVLVGVAIGVLSFLWVRNKNKQSSSTTVAFRRPASEYVLDPNWNYNAKPTRREYNWVIKDIVANPDGVFRPMVTINGMFPGELIVCNEGDTIVVNVDNQAKNATSIHWHGIFQNGTNWMDGTPGVTQCPIAPGRKFRYEFTVTGQSGTYFYHGHQAAQGLDGLVGPIVVHSRDKTDRQQIPYASDRVVMLQDWYHDLSDGLLRQTLSPGVESSPVPNGALINGANIVDCSLHPHRKCDNSTASLPTFDLAPNEHHRLRILNVGAFAWFEVTVDHHLSLPVTAVDGVGVEATADSSLLVGPGQRYSVVLNANQTDSKAFWLRARMLNHCFAENVLPENGMAEAKAIVQYGSGASANTQLPTTENDSGRYAVTCRDPAPGTYVPAPAQAAPEYAHQSWYLRVNLEIGDWRLERGFLNQSTYRPSLSSPMLHRVVDGLAAKNETFEVEGVNARAFDTESELVISSKEIETVDIIMQNFDEGNHPFHLHGSQFFVLASGHGYFPGYESLGLRPNGKGLLDATNSSIIDNPLRRDVATVEGFGWLLIRFVADNPGLWLFHCHMIWHGEAGMAMQFLSRLDVLKNWKIPEQNRQLCEVGIQELEKGSCPKDSIFYGTT
ncbi:putative l-ascorbate oxidase protein [Phaeoacremonium minimum UCRPA7]|uniref:Putative l-ascorbate oxidase protein n=1 Tax=Phaeoacremonium minimum (strain UCR-PA7) TaxID=1286976 RepID=R8BBS9_PHAM7|nr:putative l-ascorbate oxidase protein [Phaeoacremonium minimum UCRPA7]EON96793.1 putative l-ascorbate oxidase protein [Phaeoacremonium minimum UCRPA7]